MELCTIQPYIRRKCRSSNSLILLHAISVPTLHFSLQGNDYERAAQQRLAALLPTENSYFHLYKTTLYTTHVNLNQKLGTLETWGENKYFWQKRRARVGQKYPKEEKLNFMYRWGWDFQLFSMDFLLCVEIVFLNYVGTILGYIAFFMFHALAWQETAQSIFKRNYNKDPIDHMQFWGWSLLILSPRIYFPICWKFYSQEATGFQSFS